MTFWHQIFSRVWKCLPSWQNNFYFLLLDFLKNVIILSFRSLTSDPNSRVINALGPALCNDKGFTCPPPPHQLPHQVWCTHTQPALEEVSVKGSAVRLQAALRSGPGHLHAGVAEGRDPSDVSAETPAWEAGRDGGTWRRLSPLWLCNSKDLLPTLPSTFSWLSSRAPWEAGFHREVSFSQAWECRNHKRYGFSPWVWKMPWRREGQPTTGFLPGESHGQRSPACYSPWGHRELDMTECTFTLWRCFSSIIWNNFIVFTYKIQVSFCSNETF